MFVVRKQSAALGGGIRTFTWHECILTIIFPGTSIHFKCLSKQAYSFSWFLWFDPNAFELTLALITAYVIRRDQLPQSLGVGRVIQARLPIQQLFCADSDAPRSHAHLNIQIPTVLMVRAHCGIRGARLVHLQSV